MHQAESRNRDRQTEAGIAWAVNRQSTREDGKSDKIKSEKMI